MGGVIERAKPAMTVEQGVILLSFFAFPDAFFSFGVIPIIVILVYGTDDRRGVNQAGARLPGEPEQPIVPTGPADHKLGNLLMEKTLAEDEVINPLRGPLAVRVDCQFSNFVLPARALEMEWLANIHIPATAGKQKWSRLAGDTLDSLRKIVEQKNIAVYVAE